MLQVYNTMKNTKEEFKPISGNNVNIYVCGVTVYDNCHIGHARSSVVFDVIRRYFIYKKYNVRFVKNFTDIDDKIIKRSNEQNILWKDLTNTFITEHNNDMESLNILPPDDTPKATEYIQEMIDLASTLIDKGHAYESDGDVYFRVGNFKDYGKLSNRDIEDLKAGVRIEINDKKENPLDFALWKKSKENEPSWTSPWGEGRPGWHIECSAMSSKLFGLPFDIHGGGKDLIFPHHENEIAQSEAAEGCEFAKYWIHNGFVNINKEKMSKSLNNFFTIKEILKEFDPEVLRFFLLTTHYRSPLDFSTDKLQDAETALDRIYTMLDEINYAVPSKKGTKPDDYINNLANNFVKRFDEVMDDDFNTASGLSIMFEYIREINKLISGKLTKESLTLIREHTTTVFSIINNTLGIVTKTPEEWFKSNLPMDEKGLMSLIEKRLLARKEKDFQTSDQIRNDLATKGIELFDTPEGTKYRTKKIHTDI